MSERSEREAELWARLGLLSDEAMVELHARIGTAATLAFAMETIARLSASVGDSELMRLTAATHGQALDILMRLRELERMHNAAVAGRSRQRQL